MPELPEVETLVRDLRPYLLGRRIASIHVSGQPLRREWSPEWERRLIGRRVGEIRRRGKWILVGLDRELCLGIHLGMTGQLTVVPARQFVAPHTHVVITLDRGQKQLRFRDVRRFGSATLFPDQERAEEFFRASKLGPEPFDLETSYWRERLAATERCLKAVLLDQRVVAGIGNIYADESLFQARLHPCQLGRDTNRQEAERLRRALAIVLNRAIKKRGSSIRDYLRASGKKGEYQREFRVYGRYRRPCPRCRAPIERIRLAGRSTHFCPACQQRSPAARH
ncbi:MAG TPA: bifunctional DNA-formamidopyrimidine glycosylase/DNA-(apurinic or apyrimidinic site) lyase [Gemmataceae bacterium]|nr:bifunctional DNA-formamidopyrimidine glycosylase/DNA-(apurinic or apyrimidinic site) lyase [Gemmataceae bacterium]